MSTGTLCSRVVATAAPDESIRVAARRMAKNDVGTLVVLEGAAGGRPVGVVTDRDIAMRCTAAGMDPDETPIREIMSQPVHTVGEYVDVADALSRMARSGTRRLVVTGDEGRLMGIFSLDDALDSLAQQATAVGQLLSSQQPHIPA